MAGKTIQIYLPNGKPNGLRKASITTEKPVVFQIPLTEISNNIDKLDFNGIYILIDSVTTEKPKLYIGKGKVKSRIQHHIKKKSFWNTVFAIQLDSINGFSGTDISYLEYYFIKKAKEFDNIDSEENRQIPQIQKLQDEKLDELTCYIETIEFILSTLGLKCFQDESKDNILTCKDKYGSFGQGRYNPDSGFLLLKGAKCRMKVHRGTKSLSKRDDLIKKAVLQEENGFYKLTEDTLFSTVSSAAQIVLARNANGWTEWKNKAGKTLNDLYRIK